MTDLKFQAGEATCKAQIDKICSSNGWAYTLTTSGHLLVFSGKELVGVKIFNVTTWADCLAAVQKSGG